MVLVFISRTVSRRNLSFKQITLALTLLIHRFIIYAILYEWAEKCLKSNKNKIKLRQIYDILNKKKIHLLRRIKFFKKNFWEVSVWQASLP